MSAGTLVSWLTCTGTIFTPSSLANSLPSVQDEPIHGSPEPEVFCTSQGGLLTTPTRSTPALRMASMRSLAPGSGGVWAWAEAGAGQDDGREGQSRGGAAGKALLHVMSPSVGRRVRHGRVQPPAASPEPRGARRSCVAVG